MSAKIGQICAKSMLTMKVVVFGPKRHVSHCTVDIYLTITYQNYRTADKSHRRQRWSYEHLCWATLRKEIQR